MTDPVLTTARLVLRLQRIEDIGFLTELWTDPQTTEHLGGPRDRTFLEKEFRSIALSPSAEEWDLWPLETREEGRLVGYAGYLPKTIDEEPFIEVTYLLAPEARGQGLATEVAQALVDRAFGTLGLKTVVALIAPANLASRRVAVRVGLRFWKTTFRDGVEKEVWRVDAPGGS